MSYLIPPLYGFPPPLSAQQLLSSDVRFQLMVSSVLSYVTDWLLFLYFCYLRTTLQYFIIVILLLHLLYYKVYLEDIINYKFRYTLRA